MPASLGCVKTKCARCVWCPALCLACGILHKGSSIVTIIPPFVSLGSPGAQTWCSSGFAHDFGCLQEGGILSKSPGSLSDLRILQGTAQSLRAVGASTDSLHPGLSLSPTSIRPTLPALTQTSLTLPSGSLLPGLPASIRNPYCSQSDLSLTQVGSCHLFD